MQLIKAIKAKCKNKELLKAIESEEEPGLFRKDKNSFPRLCNFLMQYPDALQRSALLGNRFELETRQTYEIQDIFVNSVEDFNSNKNSGGLVKDHEEYKARSINPEVKSVGLMSTKQGYKIWKDVLKVYQCALTKFEASGKHNTHDFYNYVQGDIDALYLFHWLQHLDYPELTAFCQEGNVIVGGLDIGFKAPDCNPVTPTVLYVIKQF